MTHSSAGLGTARKELNWVHIYLVPDVAGQDMVREDLAALREKATDTDTASLVLYEPAVNVIGAQLDAGMALQEALQHWRQEATALLQVTRRQRRRIVLIEYPADPAIAGDITQNLGKTHPGLDLALVAPLSAPCSPNAAALAALALHHDEAAFELLSELEASSIGPFSGVVSPMQGLATLADGLSTQRDLARELDTRTQELETARAESATHAKAEALLTDQVAALETALQEARDTQASQSEDLQARTQELETARAESATHAKAEALLTDQVTALEAALQEARNTQAAQSEDLQARSAELDARTQELKTARAKSATHAKAEALLTDQVAALEAALQEARNTQAAQSEDLQARSAELDTRTQELESTRAESATHAKTEALLLQQVRELETALAKTENSRAAMSSELRKTTQQVDERTAALQDAEKARYDLEQARQKEVVALKDSLDQAFQELGTLKTQLTETRSGHQKAVQSRSLVTHDTLKKLEETLQEAERTSQEASKLQDKIEEIYSSSSWRLTAPLRSLARRIRR